MTDACYQRHRHQEFQEFLKQVAREYPRQQLHVVCDNHSTQSTRRSRHGWKEPAGHPGLESPQKGAPDTLPPAAGGNGQDPQRHLRPCGHKTHGGAHDRAALPGNQQQFALTGVGGFELGETPQVGVIDNRVELSARGIEGGG